MNEIKIKIKIKICRNKGVSVMEKGKEYKKRKKAMKNIAMHAYCS